MSTVGVLAGSTGSITSNRPWSR